MKISIWDYDKIIQKILDKHNIMCSIEPTDKETPMSYSVSYNQLRTNLLAIQRYIKSGKYPSLNEEEILTIMTYHEIGHYLDFQNHPHIELRGQLIKRKGDKEEWKMFVLEREKNAWKYGRELVPENLLEEYDKLNEESFKIYENE